ncbi:MAG: NAD(P)-dependent oxidoreductase [Acidimicrobiales bacterium]
MIIALDLEGARSIVIGESPEALIRATRLAEEGSLVTYYFGAHPPQKGSIHPSITLRPGLRPPRRALRRARLVLATDRDARTNAFLARVLRGRPNLLNTLDEKQTCNFFHVATRRPHPSISIAVSTHGQSPRFAGVLVDQLAKAITATDLNLFEKFVAHRDKLHATGASTMLADWSAIEATLRSTQTNSVELSLETTHHSRPNTSSNIRI